MDFGVQPLVDEFWASLRHRTEELRAQLIEHFIAKLDHR
jgi:hypothetical protein